VNNGVSEHIRCKNIGMAACRPLQTVRANQDKSTGSGILPSSVRIESAPVLTKMSLKLLPTKTRQFKTPQNTTHQTIYISCYLYLCKPIKCRFRILPIRITEDKKYSHNPALQAAEEVIVALNG